MSEFKDGDWVTIGDLDYCAPGKKYQVMEDDDGDLYIIGDDGLKCWLPFWGPELYKVEKTTPPEPNHETTQDALNDLKTFLKNNPTGNFSSKFLLERFFGITSTEKTVTTWSDEV